MKQFIPTYLYVKTHNVTGLKYFGKTTGNPNKYRGSGVYWLQHIKKHGYDVTTEVFGYYIDKDECVKAATFFSVTNNIVYAVDEHNKKIWANQINENGTDGGNTGRTNYKPHTAEARQKMSLSRKGSVPWNKGKVGVQVSANKGKTLSEETKQKIRNANLGKKQSAETIAKRSAKLKGAKRSEEFIKKITGRKHSQESIEKMKLAQQGKIISEETKAKISATLKGRSIPDATKKKLSGKVVVIDKAGKLLRITKEQYYTQTGSKINWEWIMHRCKEAKMRRG